MATLLQAPSIDAAALTALLDRIPVESEHRPVESYSHPTSRSSTVEPPENEEYEYEIKCHQALLDDNCRPLFHVNLLPHIEANPDAHIGLLRPWIIQQHPADVEGQWQALSRQWNRWNEFRAWQLHGRRRRPGFGAYLDAYRRNYLMRGGFSRRAAEPKFEQAARLLWERDYGDYCQDEEDVEKHAEVVRRLLPRGFVIGRPLKLLMDPKTQDPWTTYTEYLAFEAERLYLLVKDAQRLERRGKEKDEVAEAKVDQQQCRIDWVLSEIEKIKEEHKAATGEDSSGKTGSNQKRRLEGDTDVLQPVTEPRLQKLGRMEKVDEAIPRTKCNLSTHEQEENDVSGSRSKRRKLASTSDGPGSVMQVSAPCPRPRRTETPRGAPAPRRQRIETLRPRVNGRAATFSTSTNVRRHGAATRPRGGPRAGGERPS